jgi:hypothetical protein
MSAHTSESTLHAARTGSTSQRSSKHCLLLLISDSPSGFVVFAFRGNTIIAYITVAIATFCVLWYIILTLAPIVFHDCPYQTPLSTPFWLYAQVIQLSVLSVAFHAAKLFGNKLRVVKTGVVEAFRDVLAPYAAGTYNCLDLLPLSNPPESLRLIEELWDAANDEVALSVR